MLNLGPITSENENENPRPGSISEFLGSISDPMESPLDLNAMENIISKHRYFTMPIVDELLNHFLGRNKVEAERNQEQDAARKLLSCAIKYKCIGAIKTIVRHYPNDWKDWRDAMGMTPLHIVFGYDTITDTNTTRSMDDIQRGNDDDDGQSKGIRRSKVLEVLLSEIMPNDRRRALFAKCRQGRGNNSLSTPMDCALYYLNLKYKRECESTCEDEWKCLQLCVEAASAEGKFQIIHYCITLKLLTLHGELLTDMIARLGTGATKATAASSYDPVDLDERDEYGRTPLLLAIQEQKTSYIRQLLLLNPTSAKRPVRRYCLHDSSGDSWYRRGRLPLHVALDHTCIGDRPSLDWEGVELILKASSADALRVRDPVMGILPFMQAAVACRRRRITTTSVTRSSRDLADIYRLLLAEPSALECRNQPSTVTKAPRRSVDAIMFMVAISIVVFAILWERMYYSESPQIQ